jgi:hypothetical protein
MERHALGWPDKQQKKQGKFRFHKDRPDITAQETEKEMAKRASALESRSKIAGLFQKFKNLFSGHQKH